MKTRLSLLSIFLVSVLFLPAPAIADLLDIQVGDTVNARLNSGRVDPKVGGITVSVDGETYGGSTCRS